MAIAIVEYDPAWPRLFAEERDRIVAACGGRIVAVEHVGSTAVPGLAAKPIIDMMPGVRALADAGASVGAMVAIGYEYVPALEDALPERRFFRKDAGGVRSHHIHMVEVGSEFWELHILFRDYLVAHPQVTAGYARLKRELAARYGDDREGYTEAKTPFIRSVEERARAESALS